MLLLFVLIAAEPEVMLFLICLLYIASGPGMAVYSRIRGLKKEQVTSHHPS